MAVVDFLEYLNSQGSINEPSKDMDAVDIPKDRGTRPYKDSGMVGTPNPYIAEKGSHSSDKGLGDQGDKDLKYDVSKNVEAKKLLTAEASIQTIRKAMLTNPRIVEHLVNELYQADLLGCLVAELSTYKETYQHLSEIMANESYGQQICDRLVKAMSEAVSPPFNKEEDEIELDNEDDDADDMEDALIDDEVPAEMPLKKPMPKALEHFTHSLNKRFI